MTIVSVVVVVASNQAGFILSCSFNENIVNRRGQDDIQHINW